MPADTGRIVVFVHGFSVRDTGTYGQLPARLQREAQRAAGLQLDVRNIWLGKYISFADEVRMEDVSRAFENALRQELKSELDQGRRFVCITHSTGGPVARDWWQRFYSDRPAAAACPMSHLIMLAPANFGSTLATLGKSRVARIKSWFEGVEPGSGLLDWLELGSPESWDLNLKWIASKPPIDQKPPVYPFVLTGQSIDRALYDHLNSYTDESGSDGVIRTCAANLNATYVRIAQEAPPENARTRRRLPMTQLRGDGKPRVSPRTAFALIAGRSHSGDKMGILRSVVNDDSAHPTVDAVLRCLLVSNRAEYVSLCDAFDSDNRALRGKERVELHKRRLFPDSIYFHDTHAMVVFRLVDDTGRPVSDFDLKLTAGKQGRVGPDFLPTGFFVDRQRNKRGPGLLTYYLNHDVMMGSPAVPDPRDQTSAPEKRRVLRPAQPGAETLGLEIVARPDEGFVHYHPASLQASKEVLENFLQPDRTTLVDIVLRRVVREGVFRLTKNLQTQDFTGQPPGGEIS